MRVRTKRLTAMRYDYGISITRFFQGNKYADSIELQNKLVIFRFIEVLIALNNKILSNSMTEIIYSLYRMWYFWSILHEVRYHIFHIL